VRIVVAIAVAIALAGSARAGDGPAAGSPGSAHPGVVDAPRSPLAQPAAQAGSGSGSSSAKPASTTSGTRAGSAAKPTAPSIKNAPPAAAAEKKPTAKESTLYAIEIIAGLLGLLVLSYLGGNRRVVRFQEQLGISGVITAGFPFVALGLIARRMDILSGDVLHALRPVLHFGLGWLGFIIGAQLDIRVLDRVPKGTAYLILVEALGPFAITAAGCGIVMVTFGLDWHDRSVWRDLVLLGSAAAMTAPRKFRGFANRTWHEGRGVDILLGQLDELVGVVGLLFITAYFRDDASSTWHIPDTVWILISLGLGVAVGALIFAMIRVPASDPEFLAIVLGGIAFASGLAGYLHLSPIVVCFVAGALVTNFPNDQRDSVFRILQHLERPVQLLFLLVVGAVWDVADWRGWVLVPLFVAGRAIGKWTGVIASKTAVGALLPVGFADNRAYVTPMSGLAIALVINALSLGLKPLGGDPGLGWIVTAVVGGAIASELLMAKLTTPDEATPLQPVDELAGTAPVDELSEHDSGGVDGPIYRDDPPPPPKPHGSGGGH
jgi:Kef-type K+ transport system membrane component KefB